MQIILTIHLHPPCRVDIKHTLSLLFSYANSLSSNSQSTSFIKTSIPGRSESPLTKKSAFFYTHIFLRCLINNSTVYTVSDYNSTSNCFFP